MQRCSHSPSTATALRSIFFPTNNQTCISTFLAPSYATDFNYRSQLPFYQSRSASSYTGNSYASSRAASSQPSRRIARPRMSDAEMRQFGVQQDRKPKDEEIQGDLILLVQEKGQGPPQRVSRARILSKMDRDHFFLVQVGLEAQQEQPLQDNENEDAAPRWVDPAPPTPVCKIMDRKSYFLGEQNKNKKSGGGANKPKELEFSWGIDKNDLNHRLVKAEDFLADDKKVEIALAPKKRGKPVTADEAAALVRQIKERLLQHKTVKESKPMEGEIGGQLVLFFERKS